jgi:uncharacterized membrane protein YvlD (DUF360 family)
MLGFVVRVLVDTLAFFAISKLMPGFKIKKDSTAVCVALVYGILMAIGMHFLRIGLGLSFFVSFFTGPLFPFFWIGFYGMFLVVGFVLSVGVLMLTDYLLDDFAMDTTATAVVGAAILAVIQVILGKLL